MLTTTRGILIRTKIADTRPIGRNTQGVRLIRVEDGDTVRSLAKLPEEELSEEEAEALAEAPVPQVEDGTGHILDDGVAEAEASDHIDDLDRDGEPDA
jgi:DNA gyrase subunit A